MSGEDLCRKASPFFKATAGENAITIDMYRKLCSSVGWLNFSIAQITQELSRSPYSIAVFDAEKPVEMGRVVGDGIYNTICDIVVDPA